MIKSYWLRILMCGLAAAILGFLIALVTPKQYEAVVQILVAPYSGGSLRPSQSEAEDSVQDLLQTSAPRSVTTQVEALTAWGILQTAAQNVGHDFNLPYQNAGDELSPIELQDRISVSAAKDSDMVTLRVRLSAPNIAQAVAAEMYKAFADENDRQSRGAANLAIEYLDSQNKDIQAQLTAVDDATAKAKEEAGAPNIDIQIQSDIAALKDLQAQLDLAQADQQAQQARADDLRQQIPGTSATISSGNSVAESATYQALQAQLVIAMANRNEALGTYMEDSQQVKAIDRRIAGINAQIKITPRYTPNIKESTSSNPVLTTLKSEYVVSEANAKGAAQRVAETQAALARMEAKMAKLPGIQRKLADLQRRQVVLERLSQIYATKLDSLKLAKGGGRRASTYLWTGATAFPKPAVPNPTLNVGLGLFLGLAVGFLWSVGTEAKRNPIRSLGQLNRLSLQPCYRVVPELRVPMRGLTRPPAEVFETLLANFVRSEKKGYRLGVLGVTKGAGATTTAMNLAIAAARGGYTVLYVEVDPGNNALTKLTPSAGDIKSPGANISIFNASLGETTSNGTVGLPTELQLAAEGKDLVLFDFPPVKVAGDAFLVANQLDEMIMLVRANATRSVDFLQAQQALIDAGCPMVSVALSRVQDQSDDVAALEQQADTSHLAVPPM